MESFIVQIISEFGVSGGFLIIVLIENYNMKKKLFEIIEKNTQAFTLVHEVVEKCKGAKNG